MASKRAIGFWAWILFLGFIALALFIGPIFLYAFTRDALVFILIIFGFGVLWIIKREIVAWIHGHWPDSPPVSAAPLSIRVKCPACFTSFLVIKAIGDRRISRDDFVAECPDCGKNFPALLCLDEDLDENSLS